jgi:adenosylhomocysteine nucleosidase
VSAFAALKTDFARRVITRIEPVNRTLVVVGLASEARLFANANRRIVVGGGKTAQLSDALAAAATPEITHVLSFGIAGGLRAGLRPGSLVVAERVFDGADIHETDPEWRAGLLGLLAKAIRGDLIGVDVPVAATSMKAHLARTTGAAAVDMESHVAARFARTRGLRFSAVRAVADPAERVLPPAALVAMRADGGINLPAVARSLIRQPSQIGAVVRLGFDNAEAMKVLEAAARAVVSRRHAHFQTEDTDLLGHEATVPTF